MRELPDRVAKRERVTRVDLTVKQIAIRKPNVTRLHVNWQCPCHNADTWPPHLLLWFGAIGGP